MRPLKIHFDVSCGTTLRSIIFDYTEYFVPADAASADVILFGSDEIEHVKISSLYHVYPAKCLCITETDTPTFRLRGLYAANQISFLTAGRTRTINYLISERERANVSIKNLIGRPMEKKYLYSFMGGMNSWARKRLVKSLRSSDDTIIEATDSYNHWSNEEEMTKRRGNHTQRFAETIAASKYVLCPRGCGLSSYRLFEVMSLSVAPVIIADKWQPIEEIDWSFALFVPESSIGKIDSIVRAHESEWRQRGEAAGKAWQSVLGPDAIGQTVHGKISALLGDYHPASESVAAITTQTRDFTRRRYWQMYAVAKKLVLRGFHVTGMPFPFPLHEPVDQQLGKRRDTVQ